MTNGDIQMILWMVVLVAFSAVFSATETAFNCASRTRLKAMDTPKAERTLALLERYDDLLSAILVGNNIVNIALASVGTVFFVSHLGDVGATVSTLVITVVVLIFGEVSPKSIASDCPEAFAIFMTPAVKVMLVILTPVTKLFGWWKGVLDRLLRVEDDRHVTSEELLVMVDEAEHDGEVDKEESELLRSAIEFGDREAEDILTHRVDLEGISVDAQPAEISQKFIQSKFSRLLVYGEDMDDIVGVLHLKDFYREHESRRFSVKKIMTEPLFAPQSLKIDDLLHRMQKAKASVAVISDEYGGTLGIVTIEDIVEELVGEIWDEHDEVVEDFTKLSDGRVRVSGSAELEDFFDYFLQEDVEEGTDLTTVSGWVMQQLGRIPEAGEKFVYRCLEVTVEEVDNRRVEQVTVHILPEDTAETSSEPEEKHPEEEAGSGEK